MIDNAPDTRMTGLSKWVDKWKERYSTAKRILALFITAIIFPRISFKILSLIWINETRVKLPKEEELKYIEETNILSQELLDKSINKVLKKLNEPEIK